MMFDEVIGALVSIFGILLLLIALLPLILTWCLWQSHRSDLSWATLTFGDDDGEVTDDPGGCDDD